MYSSFPSGKCYCAGLSVHHYGVHEQLVFTYPDFPVAYCAEITRTQRVPCMAFNRPAADAFITLSVRFSRFLTKASGFADKWGEAAVSRAEADETWK